MRLASLLLLAMFLAGCGTKGPLYFRDNPPAGVKPPRPETYQPVPYPKDAEEDTGADPAKK